MKRRSLTFFLLLVFLMWNVLTYLFIAHKPRGAGGGKSDLTLIERHLAEMQRQIKEQTDRHQKILHDLQQAENLMKGNIEHTYPLNNSNNSRAVTPRHTTPSPPDGVGGVSPSSRTPYMYKTNKFGGEDYPELDPGSHGDPGKTAVGEVGDHVDPNKVELAVLVIACNRPSVSRNLDQIIKYRSSVERFPIVVSQDCNHAATADVIRSYGSKVTHIQHPDLSDIPLPKKDQKFKGYYKIARHYKWALNQVFHTLNYKVVIIIEDDLDLSPDFFEYMSATYPILRSDPTLWCVSAWNDNGKEGMVSNDPELLYRTDFFPGLGWMLEKKIWMELESKWPQTFWDDWMRHPDQRRERSCVRPEISRSKTFGKIGVSRGQFFDKYLKFIKLNGEFVPFTKKDLSYLKKENYDEMFVKKVYSAPLLSALEVQRTYRPEERAVRVQYTDKANFKSQAKSLGLMDDLKSGVPRAGYRGIVSFMYKDRRVYLAPSPSWTGYDPTWS